jgi:hypothetical protein
VALSDSPEGREKRIAGNGWHGSDGESTTFGLFEKGEPRIRFIPPQTPSSATGLEKVIRRLDPPPNDRGDQGSNPSLSTSEPDFRGVSHRTSRKTRS